LLVTILVEGIVGAGYCLGRGKPVRPVLLTSVLANLITQSLLWVVLNVFFSHYFIALFAAEIVIWMIESLLLSYIPANRMRIGEALLLSLGMNLVSFALGWVLPV
jgi:hypothetical protein